MAYVEASAEENTKSVENVQRQAVRFDYRQPCYNICCIRCCREGGLMPNYWIRNKLAEDKHVLFYCAYTARFASEIRLVHACIYSDNVSYTTI